MTLNQQMHSEYTAHIATIAQSISTTYAQYQTASDLKSRLTLLGQLQTLRTAYSNAILDRANLA